MAERTHTDPPADTQTSGEQIPGEQIPGDQTLGDQTVGEWRKRMRTQLIERRLARDPQERAALAARARQRLLQSIALDRFRAIGIYWPMRGEVDVRDLARRHHEAGGEVALPVVVDKRGPLEFWRWHPDAELSKGAWDIPIPKERELLQPDALIIPLLGFDAAGFRLGYGGGYYDRTLAALARRPFCIGLGYAEAELATIYPQSYDLPMDAIVTEEFVRLIS